MPFLVGCLRSKQINDSQTPCDMSRGQNCLEISLDELKNSSILQVTSFFNWHPQEMFPLSSFLVLVYAYREIANTFPKIQESILPDFKKCRFVHTGITIRPMLPLLRRNFIKISIYPSVYVIFLLCWTVVENDYCDFCFFLIYFKWS